MEDFLHSYAWIWSFWGIVGVLVALIVTIAFFVTLWLKLESALRSAKKRHAVNKARQQFKDDALKNRFPSEAVLAVLADSTKRFYCGEFRGCSFIPLNLFSDRDGREPTWGDAVDRIRKRRQVDQERELSLQEHKLIAGHFVELVSTCSSPWDAITRMAKAIKGEFSSLTFIEVTEYDVVQVLSTIGVASGDTTPSLGSLYQAIFAKIAPAEFLSVTECFIRIKGHDRKPIELPRTLDVFRTFEQASGQHLAPKIAGTYWLLVTAACYLVADSVAVAGIKTMYFNLLNPFLFPTEGNGNDALNLMNCEECKTSRDVLGVPVGASQEVIKEAHRDLAKVWHPDRFREDDQRVRRRSEIMMQEVNDAYMHLQSHAAKN